MGMDIDAACHDDLACRIVTCLRTTVWCVDDSTITNPDITHGIATMGRVDDASTGNARQHGRSSGPGVAAEMREIASATEIIAVGRAAAQADRVPLAARCWTPE